MARNNSRYYTLAAVREEMARLSAPDSRYELVGWNEILYSPTGDPVGPDPGEVTVISYAETEPDQARPGYYHFALVVRNKADGREEVKFFSGRMPGQIERNAPSKSAAILDLEAANKALRDTLAHMQAHNAQLGLTVTTVLDGLRTTVTELKTAMLANAEQRGAGIDPRMVVGAVAMWQDLQTKGVVSDQTMTNLGRMFVGGEDGTEKP